MTQLKLPPENPGRFMGACPHDDHAQSSNWGIFNQHIWGDYDQHSHYGIRLLPVIQNGAQLENVYGPKVATEIEANCGVQMVMRPATTADAREISERLGTYTFRARSRSMGKWGRGGGSVSDSDQRRPLLLPQELMQLPEKDMIVLRLGIPPVYGRKIRFYEEKDMVALTKIPAPTMPTIRPDPAAATNSLRVIAAAEPATARSQIN